MASRVLVDASTLIALAQAGALDILGALPHPAWTTEPVRDEVLVEGFPETAALKDAFAAGKLLRVIGSGGRPRPLERLGLGPGEASLIAAATPEDLLVVDDANARRLADARGLRRTGLLGLLVALVEDGRVEGDRALRILSALARSDFRMTVALYDWAAGRIRGGPNR